VSGLQPSYGIHNDPLPVALRSGPAGHGQRAFRPMMAVLMAQVEQTFLAGGVNKCFASSWNQGYALPTDKRTFNYHCLLALCYAS
jgi:hypothetical protein